MTDFPVHTLDTAPAASRPSMEALRAAFGLLPNIAAVMATSPVLIGGLVGLFGQVHGGSFSEAEIQTLLLTDAVANRAAWAVAFHTHLALHQGIDAADVSALRRGLAPQDARLAALSVLARAMIEQRGHLREEQKQAFLDAGFTPEHLLEVVTVVAASTITNYTATIAQPPLEPAFAAHAWHGDMR